MTAWDDIRPLAERNAIDEIVKRIAELSAADRKQIAGELPRHVRSLRGDWQRSSSQAAALTVIGAGCLAGAEAVATWIARSDFAGRRRSSSSRVVEAVCELAAERPVAWQVDVGRRLSAKLRRTEWPLEDPTIWEIAAALIERLEAAVPEDDAFLLGWLRNRGMKWIASPDYFFDALVPRMFEAEGVGQSLAEERADQKTSWLYALVVHADRAVLLDGCVSRFLRGGRDHDQRWFIRLHAALDPTPEESAVRLRDYVRLLPTAGKPVAETALNEILRADKDTPLPADLFADTAEAVLFRTDKKLVRTALIWMDRTARSHGRIDTTLLSVSTVFRQEALDLQERAVKLVIKHAGKAEPDTSRTLREAASALPPHLRERIAAAFGAVEAVQAPSPVPLFIPAVSPLEPISSSAELVEELSAYFSNSTTLQAERLLPALLSLGPSSRDALTRVVEARRPWIMNGSVHLELDSILVALLTSYPCPPLLRSAITDPRLPRPAMVFPTRVQEAATALGDRRLLLATPTLASGHVDPEILVARMHDLEAADAQPGTFDLQQALLRLPRSAGPVAAAGSLKSPAGKMIHDWLTGGGMADPVVVSTERDLPVLDRFRHWHGVSSVRRCFTLTTESDLPLIKLLCDLPEPTATEFPTWWESGESWPLVLPSHREVIAVHLCLLFQTWIAARIGQGAAMLALAEADGPAGAATASALIWALSAEHPDERAAAADALVLFAARGSLPYEELAEVLPALLDSQQIKLNRLVETFTTALHSGVDLWPFYRAVLPALLPAPGARPRAALTGLLALINASAETFGTRGFLPDLAGRTGSSRLASEATRLHRTLSQQH